MNGTELKIFGARSSDELTNRVCRHLKLERARAVTTPFPDGELIVKLEEDVRGRDCFVICSTSQPVNALFRVASSSDSTVRPGPAFLRSSIRVAKLSRPL